MDIEWFLWFRLQILIKFILKGASIRIRISIKYISPPHIPRLVLIIIPLCGTGFTGFVETKGIKITTILIMMLIHVELFHDIITMVFI